MAQYAWLSLDAMGEFVCYYNNPQSHWQICTGVENKAENRWLKTWYMEGSKYKISVTDIQNKNNTRISLILPDDILFIEYNM